MEFTIPLLLQGTGNERCTSLSTPFGKPFESQIAVELICKQVDLDFVLEAEFWKEKH